MTSPNKKLEKAKAKRLKKQQKSELKLRKAVDAPREASSAVRYAESVRGCLYVLMGASMAVALVLGQRGAIISLDDVIESLFAAIAGKVVLSLIALALLIYGFKMLRLVR